MGVSATSRNGEIHIVTNKWYWSEKSKYYRKRLGEKLVEIIEVESMGPYKGAIANIHLKNKEEFMKIVEFEQVQRIFKDNQYLLCIANNVLYWFKY